MDEKEEEAGEDDGTRKLDALVAAGVRVSTTKNMLIFFVQLLILS